jgi:hypothetical protein
MERYSQKLTTERLGKEHQVEYSWIMFFTILQAAHGDKEIFFWMDGKRKILIVSFPHCIHVTAKKKHGNVGGK